jgi:biotin carboxyl carrier protein
VPIAEDQKGLLLRIVEAMKTMDEIQSDVSGVLCKILVKNVQPVEFTQPLFQEM